MARLHEYQGKSLLREQGLRTPRGGPASTPEEAARVAADIGAPVVVKIQAWTTGRAAIGGVAFADTPEQAKAHAARMLGMRVGAFHVEQVLVEEKLDIERELFVSLTVDDAARAPMLLLSFEGGSGIEDRGEHVHRVPVGADGDVVEDALNHAICASATPEHVRAPMADAISRIALCARRIEARSLEVNPLVVTRSGGVVAADCRVTVDDYAVFRHPELGIDIARELDHPPTELERIAYRIEQADHRGTFYFAVLPTEDAPPGAVIGFHGAGGGGSMMSLDAISAAGFTPANFTDTSGNPSAAKVYAAARVILSQPGLVGYFGSGSGVASQEQHHSAYGIAKAFLELGLDVPAVIRLGGNSEERAVEILRDACKELPARVEGYTKDDTPAQIAQRFRELVAQNRAKPWEPCGRVVPAFVGSPDAASFALKFGAPGITAGKGAPTWEGRVWIDLARCTPEATALAVKHSGGVLREEGGKPALAVSEAEAASKDSEMIACEIECLRAGEPVVFVDLPIPGLDDDDAGGA